MQMFFCLLWSGARWMACTPCVRHMHRDCCPPSALVTVAALAGPARRGCELHPCMPCPEALYCWPCSLSNSQLVTSAVWQTGRPDSTDADKDCCPYRHDECRNVIEERYGEKAAHWVQAMLHFSRKTEVGLQVSSASTLQGPTAVMDLQAPVVGSSLLQHFMGAESLTLTCQRFLQRSDGMKGLSPAPLPPGMPAIWLDDGTPPSPVKSGSNQMGFVPCAD